MNKPLGKVATVAGYLVLVLTLARRETNAATSTTLVNSIRSERRQIPVNK
jgi:hypothetical protein